MLMSWVYIEREHFVRMCEKVGVSATVRDAIKLWAPTTKAKVVGIALCIFLTSQSAQ